MTQNQKVNILVSALVLFLLLQWFLVTQKPILLSFLILTAAFFFPKLIVRDLLFSFLPFIWITAGLALLYFFPNQITLFLILIVYSAGLHAALVKKYDWWQAASIFTVFFTAGAVWFFSLAQAINFGWGMIFLASGPALILGQSLFLARRKGELAGIKSKTQIVVLAGGSAAAFAEITWAISFLPFSYFILAAIFTVLWVMTFNIFRLWAGLFDEPAFRHATFKNLLIGSIFIIIFIVISPWLPQR